MGRQGDRWWSLLRLKRRERPTPAAQAALNVHRRVLERGIDQRGWTREGICAEIGWREKRLRRLLDRAGPLFYEDLFTVLETIGVTREEYFEEVSRELAELERG